MPDEIPTEPQPRPARRRPRLIFAGAAAAALLAVGAGGGALAVAAAPSGASAAPIGSRWDGSGPGWGGGSGGYGFPGSGSPGSGSFGSQGSGSGGGTTRGGSSGSAAVDSTAADTGQSRGVVTIVSQLEYGGSESAGTGIVLTSGGRVLTNNHVIDGATAIRVTDQTTGRSYTAKVVGTVADEDVAVLQLSGASGLATATIADDAVSTGDDVTAVGNAEGTGSLTAADGTVTRTGQRITTESEGSAAGETLDGLIETSADVVAGDSGGPLLDADGAVVGIDTAATSGSAEITGYAIPIATALKAADRVLAGQETDGVTIGYPAFLGVSLSATDRGAVVAGAIDGTPAATLGLQEGDTITSVGGTSVSSSGELSAAIATHQPGERVRITWSDSAGTTHSGTATLTQGPAD